MALCTEKGLEARTIQQQQNPSTPPVVFKYYFVWKGARTLWGNGKVQVWLGKTQEWNWALLFYSESKEAEKEKLKGPLTKIATIDAWWDNPSKKE